ncbi:MAG TPA: ABC transporter permease [Sporosarcina sp.]|nr:ABC transporter permease [Sporosarcina sp.]
MTWKWDKRMQFIVFSAVSVILLFAVIFSRLWVDVSQLSTNFNARNLAPSREHVFGTDWLGRDMFTRTMLGLSLSIRVGLIGAIGSTIIAVVLGMAAAMMGKTVDRIVSWLIDLFLSVPHIVTLILISFTVGGGVKGVMIGLIATHWPSLARVIRAEVMQVRSAPYVQISRQLGKSNRWIAIHHIVPHLIPQMIIGFMLLFPHAILHEAAITFLGLGLSPHEPAIGIILSESMKYLSSGAWWLAFFPGLALLLVVRLFDRMADHLKTLLDPKYARDK